MAQLLSAFEGDDDGCVGGGAFWCCCYYCIVRAHGFCLGLFFV
jgi:hypothetical protein